MRVNVYLHAGGAINLTDFSGYSITFDYITNHVIIFQQHKLLGLHNLRTLYSITGTSSYFTLKYDESSKCI